MMIGDDENALIYLQKAIDGGNSNAQKNMEGFNLQKDNTKYNHNK